jgi:hypothetical protein
VTFIADITELRLVGVFDRGVPFKERVVIQVLQTVDLGLFSVLAGMRTAETGDLVVPMRDHVFWFGSALVNLNDWLFLYTGHGEPAVFPDAQTGGQLYTCYWNRSQTIFHDPQVVPTVVRFGGILVERRPEPAAQPPGSYLPRRK